MAYLYDDNDDTVDSTEADATETSDPNTGRRKKGTISLKDFVLAFAEALVGSDIELEDAIEHRSIYYRRLGRLFGIEKTHQRFRWNKFWLTFFSDTLAFVAFPMCKVLELIAEYRPSSRLPVLNDILTEAQWLPVPYTSFNAFHTYLFKLWAPALWSVVAFFFFFPKGSDRGLLGTDEVLQPLCLYALIGTYISTISGYEHYRIVLRRLNQALSRESQQDELHAIFAFRAHTPEGHAVEQMGCIADILYSTSYKRITTNAAALVGLVHALMPTIYRAYYVKEEPAVARDPFDVSNWYFWVTGGHTLWHALVAVPATLTSGYLTYRLIFITSMCFYNDLAFFHKLVLFRASTTAESYLRTRSRWMKEQRKRPDLKRRDFMRFLNLQRHDDLLLWVRIRHLLVETHSGFKSNQGDIIVAYMLLTVVFFSVFLFLNSNSTAYAVFCMRARVEVVVFTLWLIGIVNLKLSIHALRKSDVGFLHREHYQASLQEAAAATNNWSQTSLTRTQLEHATAQKVAKENLLSNFGILRSGSGSGGSGGEIFSMEDVGGEGSSPPTSSIYPAMPRTAYSQVEEEPSLSSVTDVQLLLERTARYIEMFDRPPRLLSFTVSIQFLRYIFLPLLSPIFAAIRNATFASLGPKDDRHDHHHHHHHHHRRY
uniref:Uncharacterized protein n=2 Tax=Hemiselmis andersenii TaxID=464988 RepID=A0A7S0THZ0_HEMAN